MQHSPIERVYPERANMDRKDKRMQSYEENPRQVMCDRMELQINYYSVKSLYPGLHCENIISCILLVTGAGFLTK